MAQVANYLDVLKLLPKNNCKDCGQPTCMVFAVKVMQGGLALSACPHLEAEVVEASQVQPALVDTASEDARENLEELKARLREMDFEAAQERLGARLTPQGLAVPMLGKEFVMSREGEMVSKCHIIPWVKGPLAYYILECRGAEPSGKWVPLRDLPHGADWGRFFEHRCEKEMKKVIDAHTDMFELMIDVFGAKPTEAFDSDIAVVLHPLPKVPLLICYWKPEDGMESDLNLFWDATAEDNLEIGSLYTLGTGMTIMFEKVARTHGA